MAKKTKSEMTAAEATRKAWGELGKDASGIDVGKLVQTKYGFDVPSSTISINKSKVFGAGGKKRGKRAPAPEATVDSLPTQLKSKTDVVKELIAQGVKMPAEIAAAAKALGHEITPNYVSMIKSKMNQSGGTKKKAPAARTSVAATTSAARVSDGNENGNGLQLENLALRFALQAGSIDAAIAVLTKLK